MTTSTTNISVADIWDRNIMKSIIEEASSISKAVDSAWIRAGKPTQFTIKVLEKPERNIFGLSVKSAKIAFLFEEHNQTETPSSREKNRSSEISRTSDKKASKQNNETKPARRRRRTVWTNELAKEATDWMDNVLQLMNLDHITYTTSLSDSAITFVFDRSLTGTESKDRMLFSSFASLILATIRARHKQQMRNLKVILFTS